MFAGLIGGIVWNLLTWLLSLPSSSSHALFGGLIGATIASLGWNGVNWAGDGTKLDGVLGKIILPAIASPIVAAICAATATYLIYRVTVGVAQAVPRRPASGGARSARRRWSPWPTARTTPRRRWA